MKEFNLRFVRGRWQDGIIDLLTEGALESIPTTAGTYVLGATDPIEFIYPWGRSPVFYIGQAHNIRARLTVHRSHIIDAEKDHDELYWWPRYQYGAAFGTTAAWYSVRGRQSPSTLEAALIEDFYEMYGAIPVANGSWPSGLKKPTRGKRDD